MEPPPNTEATNSPLQISFLLNHDPTSRPRPWQALRGGLHSSPVLRPGSPDTAQRAALLLLLPSGSQLLLSQRHLLLHGRGFLFGPTAVLLEKGRGDWLSPVKWGGHICSHVLTAKDQLSEPGAVWLPALAARLPFLLLPIFPLIPDRHWMIQP